MKRLFFLFSICIICVNFSAQDYQEVPNPEATDTLAWKNVKKLSFAWGETFERYKKNLPPSASASSVQIRAWKGETVAAQAVVWGIEKVEDLRFEIDDFACGKEKFAASEGSGFVRFVMTDELNKDGKGACGHRPDWTQFDSSLVADVIDSQCEKLLLQPYTTQPIWVKIEVPRTAKAGNYSSALKIKSGEKILAKLPIKLAVVNRELPAAKDFAFHLDLWQNPFAEARVNGVDLWSEEHFAAMRANLKLLASAGQKVVTAAIMHHPWDGQTQDAFASMVSWKKNLDGKWEFDFGVFDKWVEFAFSCGISEQINCYSMIPWSLNFRYFDQASDEFKFLKTKPGEKEYNEVWRELLTQFAKHLKEKGWFEKTTIAMDERPKAQMLEAFKIIREVDKDYKITLAGEWHEELEAELHDYCIAIKDLFPENVLNARKKAGKISTFYTCCTEARPNTFTFSPLSEAEWIGWYAAAQNLDGYLRWAYNSYTEKPLLESRFRSFGAGDCYMVYPLGRSSLRFENLKFGVQNFEKIRLLREEFSSKNQSDKLKKIDEILEIFKVENLEKTAAKNAIENARKMLINLEK